MKKIISLIISFCKTDLFKTSIWNGLATLVKIGTSLIGNKVVAIYLGPGGIALIGQFSNFINMANSFASLGFGSGITKYIAENKGKEDENRKLLSTGIKSLLAVTLIVSLIILIGGEYLSTLILHSNKYNIVFYIFSVTLPLFTLNGFLISVLNGFKEFRKIILINIISSITGLIIAIFLVIKYGVLGALVGTILSTTLIAFVTYYYVIKSHWFKLHNFIAKFDSSSFRNLSKYSLMAFSSIFAIIFVQLLVRSYIINTLSIEAAGYWQGIVKISDIYLSIITTTLGIYYLPRLSEINDNHELQKEIFMGYKFLMPICILSTITLYLLKDFIINVLFTISFLPMKELFIYQFIGNTFKIASWLLAFIMLAKSMTKIYIITELVFGLSYFVLVVCLTKLLGLKGVTVAYAVNYLLYLITMIYLFRKLIYTKHEISVH